jgi:aspartyl-tRNA(Asn)/glutamyl-tRNA(Gln) amidotransferase subunit A
MTDLAYLSIHEAAKLLRGKALSPVEYANALIERIERHEGNVHAFLRFTPELALNDALAAEAEIMRGNWRGPLHGVPFGLKDLVDYAGLPTTAQSKILQGNLAASDALVTQKFRAVGAVFMGKLALHEFATGGPSFDVPWPPARNPWNLDHFCGGSSSGSGAAVAAGFVPAAIPAAIGTDTGGSVRSPASLCGIVGMKPTYGLVSRRGVFPLAFSLDNVGPMTRTVRDNAILLDLIADSGPQRGYTHQLEQGVEGLRIGVIRHFYTRDFEADPQMVTAIDAALQKLVDLGASVREISAAPLRQYDAVYRTIMTSEAFAVHEKWMRERPQEYGAGTRERILAGAFVRAADYVNATRVRRQMADAFHALFADVDVAITASSMDPACRMDDPRALEYTSPRNARTAFNVTGSPALVVPIGYTQTGLPLSMQIVGKPFTEALIYRVAHTYETVTDWTQRHPMLESQQSGKSASK